MSIFFINALFELLREVYRCIYLVKFEYSKKTSMTFSARRSQLKFFSVSSEK